MIEYSPFDQDETLPPPPWKPADPALVAWEKAHGHDVRLKCYPEFGCQVIEQALEREIERMQDRLRRAQATIGDLARAVRRRDAAIQAVRDLCERVLADAKRPVAELRAEGRHLPAIPAMALMAAKVQAAIAAELHSHTWDERDGFCADAACHAHVNDHGGPDGA